MNTSLLSCEVVILPEFRLFLRPQPDYRRSLGGENLAMADKGAHVSGVSSNYGSTFMDSAFGANNALDGNPSTEWSSQGDGDGAWIEI